VPHTPRVNFLTAVGGPVVNVLLALAAVAALAAFSATPSFKPWADPYFPVVSSWSEGAHLGSKTGRGDLWKFTAYKHNGTFVWPDKFAENGPPTHDGKPCETVVVHPDEVVYQPVTGKPIEEQFHVWQDKEQKITARVTATPIARGVWVVLLARFFWVNWFLRHQPAAGLPARWRADAAVVYVVVPDYRQATLVAIFVGFLMMFVVLIYALVAPSRFCRWDWRCLSTWRVADSGFCWRPAARNRCSATISRRVTRAWSGATSRPARRRRSDRAGGSGGCSAARRSGCRRSRSSARPRSGEWTSCWRRCSGRAWRR
jgi:hypothetical protein